MNAIILAQLIAKGFEGEVGPMGGEDPTIEEGSGCVYLHLTSQGPDTIYQINEDGTAKILLDEDDRDSLKYDFGVDDEDIEWLFEQDPNYNNVIEMIQDDTFNSWFMYFEIDHPLLFSIIKQFVALMEAEKDENSKD